MRAGSLQVTQQHLMNSSRYFLVHLITTREHLSDAEDLDRISPVVAQLRWSRSHPSYTNPHDLPREEAFNLAGLSNDYLFETSNAGISWLVHRPSGCHQHIHEPGAAATSQAPDRHSCIEAQSTQRRTGFTCQRLLSSVCRQPLHQSKSIEGCPRLANIVSTGI